MINFRTLTRTKSLRFLVPATVVTGLAAGTAFGLAPEASSGATEPEPAAQPADDLESAPTVEATTTVQPEQATTTTTIEADDTDDINERPGAAAAGRAGDDDIAVEPASGYTLADAALADDPRVQDVECLYLSDDFDDRLDAVTEFRADRDRFFDIDSQLVQDARVDGLTYAEIAADFGFAETDVQDRAAAMHGYCYTQQIDNGLTQEQAEQRFETTISRFLTLMDAEPDENGRGAAGAGDPDGQQTGEPRGNR